MNLEAKGILKTKLDITIGTSQSGKEWKKREFVIETQDQYPKTICFTLFGDKVDLIEKFTIGMPIEVSFNVESREYQGRYFHNVNAWRVQPLAVTNNTSTAPVFNPTPEAQTISQPTPDENNDLPF